MLKLYGTPLSNNYNKAKLALLEKGLAFEEVAAPPSQEESFLQRSPMGKVPFIEVDGRFLAESQAIVEYIEETHPNPPGIDKRMNERGGTGGNGTQDDGMSRQGWPTRWRFAVLRTQRFLF